MSKKIDLTGQRFGKLLVIKESQKSRKDQIWWHVKCDCGKEKDIRRQSLRNGDSKTCGCVKKKTTEYGQSAKWALFQLNEINAKRRKIIFTLSLEEFLRITGRSCHYCGIVWSSEYPKRAMLNGSYKHNGIDRVDTTIGYVSDNCVPCCKYCNVAKSTMTVDEFRKWIIRLYSHFIITSAKELPIVQ